MDKNKIIIILVLIAAAFAAGRFLTPEKIKINTVEVEKVVTKVERQTIRIKENKDGSKDTVIVTDTTTQDNTKSKENNTESILSKEFLDVSLLAGMKFPFDSNGLVYGAAITKSFIGPTTLGVWGLSNLTFGVSGGLRF